MSWRRRLLETRAPAATLLVRAMVGAVFLMEGVQKRVQPDLPRRRRA